MGETTHTTLVVGGMTCGGCAGNVQRALEAVVGVTSAEVNHVEGNANVAHSGVDKSDLEAAVSRAGYSVGDTSGASGLQQLGSPPTNTATSAAGFHWGDRATWWQSANNTKWCLIGCSIGEFGTLGYYQWAQWPLEVAVGTPFFWFLVILPLINGLATSVTLETILLMKGQMDFSNALSTALGMSFISMLAMEIAMELTDWVLTGGIGMTWWVILPMLVVGFLTPWPYNYWRLKKYGQACH